MDALGLIIFLVFVLVKFLGKVPDIKEKLPKDRENRIPKEWGENWPPIPKGIPLPWEDDDVHDGGPVMAESGPTNKEKPTRRGFMDEKKPMEPKGNFIDKPTLKEDHDEIHRQGYSLEELLAGPATGIVKEGSEHPLLNSQSILSGIIMSEILQPPKSRRRPEGR